MTNKITLCEIGPWRLHAMIASASSRRGFSKDDSSFCGVQKVTACGVQKVSAKKST
jgi:hypothetical protein